MWNDFIVLFKKYEAQASIWLTPRTSCLILQNLKQKNDPLIFHTCQLN